MSARAANNLSLFLPPDSGDAVVFDDGSLAIVRQDIGDGWHLVDGHKRFCVAGFDMQGFIRLVLDENRKRQEPA